jgi:hypothetical protein
VTPPFFLQCEEKRIQITKNLEAALYEFRLPTSALVLWVDSVCINQSDTSERTHQVKIMGEIFREANRILVFLREEEQGIAEAFSYLSSFIPKLTKRILPAMKGHAQLTFDLADSAMFPAPSLTEYESLRKLFGRSWFRRA